MTGHQYSERRVNSSFKNRGAPYIFRKRARLPSASHANHGSKATLTDLFDEEAGFKVSNTDDVAEVSNYLRAFRLVQGQLRDPKGLPISVRLLCDAHGLLLDSARGAGKQLGELRPEPLMYSSLR